MVSFCDACGVSNGYLYSIASHAYRNPNRHPYAKRTIAFAYGDAFPLFHAAAKCYPHTQRYTCTNRYPSPHRYTSPHTYGDLAWCHGYLTARYAHTHHYPCCHENPLEPIDTWRKRRPV